VFTFEPEHVKVKRQQRIKQLQLKPFYPRPFWPPNSTCLKRVSNSLRCCRAFSVYNHSLGPVFRSQFYGFLGSGVFNSDGTSHKVLNPHFHDNLAQVTCGSL
jgi:hypothetical protein